ncbi:hypothetical protein [Sinomonas sp. P47F7]|uniref:hypothetical protein n=1 Tax=Sinomonas sp. P47F7 TaxID=3410987 RepID=UPI003BF4FDC9
MARQLTLELEFRWAAADHRQLALRRVEALLGRIAGIDDSLRSMADEIHVKGLGNTHPRRPRADQSPKSMN